MGLDDFGEYKKTLQYLNSVMKSIAPQITKIQNVNRMISKAWSSGVNTEVLKSFSVYRKQIAELSNFSKQLKEIFTSFQLSEEMQEYIKEAKVSENLTEDDFEARYGEEIEACKTLGSKGWVVSGHATPREIQEWYNAIVKEDQRAIIEFFEEDESHVLKIIIADLGKIYSDPANNTYYNRGIKAFQEGDYMTAAIYLVALLDARVNKLIHFPRRMKYYSQKFSDVGFADIKHEKYKNSNSFFTKRYYFLDVYPSMIAYLNRLFVDGDYKFEKGIEPPYINRNWVLHGRSSRKIERFECIQVLNALDMIESVLGEGKNMEST